MNKAKNNDNNITSSDLKNKSQEKTFSENREFRAYPSKEQIIALTDMQKAVQLWWNFLLDITINDFKNNNLKLGVSGQDRCYKSFANYREHLRNNDKDNVMLKTPSSGINAIIKKLLLSWKRYLKYIKENKNNDNNKFIKNKKAKIGTPKFKSGRKISNLGIPFIFDKRFQENTLCQENNKNSWISIPGLHKTRIGKRLNFAKSDSFNGDVCGIVISRRASGWYICVNTTSIKTFNKKWLNDVKTFNSKDEILENGVGIDASVKNRLVLSNGKELGKIDFSEREKIQITRINKKIAIKNRYMRKFAGIAKGKAIPKGVILHVSNSHKKLLDKKQKLLERLDNRNQDKAHKFTTEIVKNYSFIATEDLDVKSMTVKFNKGFRKSLHKSGMSKCLKMLEYKSERLNRQFIKVDKYFPSSKICFNCKEINKELTLKEHLWICKSCHKENQRDLNAAKNILAEARLIVTKNIENNSSLLKTSSARGVHGCNASIASDCKTTQS